MTPYILILSWQIISANYAGQIWRTEYNTQIAMQRFENKQACLSAGNEALKLKAPAMKAVCVPAKLPEDK